MQRHPPMLHHPPQTTPVPATAGSGIIWYGRIAFFAVVVAVIVLRRHRPCPPCQDEVCGCLSGVYHDCPRQTPPLIVVVIIVILVVLACGGACTGERRWSPSELQGRCPSCPPQVWQGQIHCASKLIGPLLGEIYMAKVETHSKRVVRQERANFSSNLFYLLS